MRGMGQTFHKSDLKLLQRWVHLGGQFSVTARGMVYSHPDPIWQTWFGTRNTGICASTGHILIPNKHLLELVDVAEELPSLSPPSSQLALVEDLLAWLEIVPQHWTVKFCEHDMINLSCWSLDLAKSDILELVVNAIPDVTVTRYCHSAMESGIFKKTMTLSFRTTENVIRENVAFEDNTWIDVRDVEAICVNRVTVGSMIISLPIKRWADIKPYMYS